MQCFSFAKSLSSYPIPAPFPKATKYLMNPFFFKSRDLEVPSLESKLKDGINLHLNDKSGLKLKLWMEK